MSTKFVAPAPGRRVYGQTHMTLSKEFANDRAGYRAPCAFCGQPHFRKCDYVVSTYVKDGAKVVVPCGRFMCIGCATTYHAVGSSDPIDFCPEHDKASREALKR